MFHAMATNRGRRNRASKGQRTRERIVAAAAPLFNQRGFAGASMADLMAATGLEKGGIYRHFESKGELVAAAFDHAATLQRARIEDFVETKRGAVARLSALGEALASLVEDPVLPGGCSLLNTAVESDEGAGSPYRELRKRTRAAMRHLIEYAREIIAAGVDEGAFPATVDPLAEAELFVATMEGALMLSKLYDDPHYATEAATRVARQAVALARSAPR